MTGINYSTDRADAYKDTDLDPLRASTSGVNLDEDLTLSGDRKRILLAVDMQNGFLTTPETETVLENVVENANLFDQVWATRFFNRNPNFSRQVNWDKMVSGPETELDPSLTPIVSKTFDKPSYSPPNDDNSDLLLLPLHQNRPTTRPAFALTIQNFGVVLTFERLASRDTKTV